ncbi:MAG: hypothetical protein U9P12_06785 [Verrucomicrobiota bacterium]|nr:hypothetical protein [Verrucomicrobiota bacterium]
MADFRINLAKTVVNSPEERQKFYNGMLIYLVLCAAAMVYVAYLSSINLTKAYRANKQSRLLAKTVSASSGYGKAFYKNPDKVYGELDIYASDLEVLRSALSRRSHFLPVMSQLFSDFPEDVALQGLTASASSKKISFGLVVPLSDQEKGDPVRQLQTLWSGNDELMQRVLSIRPITGERRMMGGQPAFFVQFECVLK